MHSSPTFGPALNSDRRPRGAFCPLQGDRDPTLHYHHKSSASLLLVVWIDGLVVKNCPPHEAGGSNPKPPIQTTNSGLPEYTLEQNGTVIAIEQPFATKKGTRMHHASNATEFHVRARHRDKPQCGSTQKKRSCPSNQPQANGKR